MTVVVGLTGGIGSGKSTVARLLAELGAVVVDGDRIARELVEPGEAALAEIAERFGPGIMRADGTLDRQGLADVVFPDPAQLAALDAIMLPRIAARSQALIDRARQDGVAVVVQDMPLLVEQGLADRFDVVLVVAAPLDLRLARLVERGVREVDARERIARQATDEQRASVADVVLDNSGDEDHLAAQVARTWADLIDRT